MSKIDATKRILTLEEKFAHLERTVADLNEVVIDQGKRIVRLETLLHRADQRIEQLHAAIDQPRSAEEERPPHY